MYITRICNAAAVDIQYCNNRGNEVLKLRSQNIQYLADLYPEIKEYI